MPWALRNATHPRERDFVVVDGFVLSVNSVMEIIDEHLNNNHLREAIINQAIIKREFNKLTDAEKSSFEATQEQMQAEFDKWRSERNLYTVASYEEYLRANGLTHSIIEGKIWDSKSYNNFLDSLNLTSIEDYFAQHSSDFSRYKVESYAVNSQDEAKELEKFLKEQPDSMCVWARKKFLLDAENNTGNQFGAYQLNTVWQYELDPEVAKLLSQNPSIERLPPVEINGKWTFVNVLSYYPPQLNQETESRIRQRLLNNWFSKKKQSCSIQWLWGDSDIFPNQNIQER